MRSLLEDTTVTTQHGYSQSQIDIIVTINISASILSLFAAIFVITNYFIISSLRGQLSYKLILWVAVSDLLFAISNCMGAPSNGIVCILQGIIMQFGSIASIFWVLAISWTLDFVMNATTLPTKGQFKRILLRMHIVIWTASAITTILPLTTNSYGPSGGWCWFKDDSLIDNIWRYALFYVIVWLAILYTIFIYIKICIKIRNQLQASEEESDQTGSAQRGISVADNTHDVAMDNMENEDHEKEKKSKQKKRKKALKRMILFPLVLIIGWLFASIRRITDLITGTAPFWLVVMQTIFSALIPFFDALVYGLTKDVRQKDKELLTKHCLCGDHD